MLVAQWARCLGAFAAPPDRHVAALRAGINITGWFRYPASRDPSVLRGWLSDAAMADLARAGFTFVRLAVDPAILDGPSMRVLFLDQVRRLQRHGLGGDRLASSGRLEPRHEPRRPRSPA